MRGRRGWNRVKGAALVVRMLECCLLNPAVLLGLCCTVPVIVKSNFSAELIGTRTSVCGIY